MHKNAVISSATEIGSMGLNVHQLYKQMRLIETVEHTLLALFAQGFVAGTIHTSIGQESCAVAIAGQLKNGIDYVFSNHRCHGHYLAFTDDVDGLVCEVLGKESGVCKGVGGSQHLNNGHFFSNGILGGVTPIAVGVGFVLKRQHPGAVAVVFLGDGAFGEGVVYEAMNIAALWKLPVLFAVEDNGYAQSTPKYLEHAGELSDRARSFGIPVTVCDAREPLMLTRSAQDVIDRVRDGQGPALIYMHTYRLAPHSKGDDSRDLREIDREQLIQPLIRLSGLLTESECRSMDDEVKARVNRAVDAALAEPTARRIASDVRSVELLKISSDFDSVGRTHLESIRNALVDAFVQDARVHLLGEDILDPYGGAFKVTKGLSTAFSDRVHTTPISEAALVGVALGMALGGLRPIVEIMFSDFLTLCADQLINHAAKFTAIYGRSMDVPLLVRTPVGAGRGYGPTHSQTLDKIYNGIPGLRVVMPSIAHDSGNVLRELILTSTTPTIFLEHKLFYGARIFTGNERVSRTLQKTNDLPLAVLQNFKSGRPDAAIVATGGPTQIIIDILSALADDEIRLVAAFPATLSPCPLEGILKAINEVDRILVVEEGTAGFDWSSEVSAGLYEHFYGRLAAPIVRLAAAPDVIPTARNLEDEVIVTYAKVEAAIYHLLGYSSSSGHQFGESK